MAKKSYGVIADGIGEFVTVPLKQGMLCGRRPYSRFLSLGSAKKIAIAASLNPQRLVVELV